MEKETGMKISTCLFGGTLLAAGIASQAQAQFSFSYSRAHTYAYEWAFGSYDGDTFIGAGDFSISSTVANNYASAHGESSANALQIRTASSVSGNGGFAYGYDVYSFFTVGQDASASVGWDWSGGFGYLSIFDITDAALVFSDGGSSSGSSPISLLQGHEYYLSGYSVSQGEGNLSSFWEVNIPAPGSAGLLGLAGLVAMRRRRHC
jgi:uncharacterized protein (TIGR03382 family)